MCVSFFFVCMCVYYLILFYLCKYRRARVLICEILFSVAKTDECVCACVCILIDRVIVDWELTRVCSIIFSRVCRVFCCYSRVFWKIRFLGVGGFFLDLRCWCVCSFCWY